MVFNDSEVARDVAKWITAAQAHSIGKKVSFSLVGTPLTRYHGYVFEAGLE
jgi:hypothetical protein